MVAKQKRAERMRGYIGHSNREKIEKGMPAKQKRAETMRRYNWTLE